MTSTTAIQKNGCTVYFLENGYQLLISISGLINHCKETWIFFGVKMTIAHGWTRGIFGQVDKNAHVCPRMVFFLWLKLENLSFILIQTSHGRFVIFANHGSLFGWHYTIYTGKQTTTIWKFNKDSKDDGLENVYISFQTMLTLWFYGNLWELSIWPWVPNRILWNGKFGCFCSGLHL